jgi:hypothetical protein
MGPISMAAQTGSATWRMSLVALGTAPTTAARAMPALHEDDFASGREGESQVGLDIKI